MTATLAAALLVPFTFFLDPVPAIAAIITMSAMTIFAGDIPSALLRIPGTPSSAAYTEDAYALTRNGKGAVGLGVSLVASVLDRKSTRLNSSHVAISYAVFCLKKKT